MGIAKKVAIFVLSLSLLVFIALFGRLPIFRRSPIGFLHRLVWCIIPRWACTIDDYLTKGWLTSTTQRWGHYLMNDNHPVILIFFLAVVAGSQCLFIPAAWSRLSSLQRYVTISLSSLTYLFIYLSVFTSSSLITHQNHYENMRIYPYDHVLFHPGQICRTCQFLKPARSKHCSICKACVAKHDHHCVWIMNCVGRDNYAYFLGMLSSLMFLLLYGASLTILILNGTLEEHTLRRANGFHERERWSVGKNWTSYWELWIWAVTQDLRIGGVGMLALLTAPLAAGLLLYHIYLIWAGMTTNENSKWADWRLDIADGLVFRRQRVEEIPSQPNIEPLLDWPTVGKQLLVSFQNGQPPKLKPLNPHIGLKSGLSDINVAGAWKKVDSLQEVENVYDLGFGDNLRDALGIRVGL